MFARRHRIGQHAHERAAWPVHMKRIGMNRGAGLCLHNALLVVIVGKGFFCGEERGPDRGPVRAHPHGLGKGAPIGDGACGQNRNMRIGDDLGQKRPQILSAAHMAASLNALRNQNLRARFLGGLRLGGAANLAHRQDARIADAFQGFFRQVPE